MSKIAFVNKSPGSKLTPEDVNEIKSVVNENMDITNSPFITASVAGSNGDAVLDVIVDLNFAPIYDRYGVIYIWRNLEGAGWLIRMLGRNTGDSDWTNIGQFAAVEDGYTPTSDIELIAIGGISVLIDWSKVPDNSADNNLYELKKSCVKKTPLNPINAIDNSPFINAPAAGSNGDAVLDVVVDLNTATLYDRYSIIYIWRNHTTGGWLIRFQGRNTGDAAWTNIGEWIKPVGTYTPSADVEWINIANGKYKVLIDWSKVPNNSQDNNLYELKKSCIQKDTLLPPFAAIDNCPFINAPAAGSNGDAVLDVVVDLNTATLYDRYSLVYIWRNLAPSGGWLIRVQGRNTGDADWANIGQWSAAVGAYVPSADVEWIIIANGKYKVLIDWSKVPNNSADNNVYELKKSCLTKDPKTEGVFTPGSVPESIASAVSACLALTDTFIKYTQYEFFLCYLWKNLPVGGGVRSLIRFGYSLNGVFQSDNYIFLEWTTPQANEIKTYSIGEMRITIDWSKIAEGFSWNGTAGFKNELFDAAGGLVPESFGLSDQIETTITVKKDGTGNFTTIAAAYASITDSTFDNQYEICVYPGKYEEQNLIPPPYTHTHGLAPNSVTVSSAPWAGVNTLPVFDQRNGSSKLSNMTIESYGGYAIHYDVGLSKKTLVNENLILRKVDFVGSPSNAIIGGGSFLKGTVFHWKSCTFDNGMAACHTNGNVVNENVHLIFEECIFSNAYVATGSVGGFGHCVAEFRNCTFPYGADSVASWYSPIRNLADPTLYLFNTVEWQVIGGGNKNFAPKYGSGAKSIKLEATTDIEISGSAAGIIFGNMPTVRSVGSRFGARLTSMYNIQDVQAGMDGYSTRVDVFQLWKRLGDCSVVNKTLTVTAQGSTETYTFTEDYLTSEAAQTTIVAAMQAALTNVSISVADPEPYVYDTINTTDKIFVIVNDLDVLRGEFITFDGTIAIDTTPVADIAGIVLADSIEDQSAPVWSGCFYPDSVLTDGDYGLTGAGVLSTGAATKIGKVKGGCFYPKY